MEESLNIRDAVEADLEGIVAITNEVIATTDAIWTEQPQTLRERVEWFRARTGRGFPVVVAVDGGSVCCFASFGPFRD